MEFSEENMATLQRAFAILLFQGLLNGAVDAAPELEEWAYGVRHMAVRDLRAHQITTQDTVKQAVRLLGEPL